MIDEGTGPREGVGEGHKRNEEFISCTWVRNRVSDKDLSGWFCYGIKSREGVRVIGTTEEDKDYTIRV